MTASRAADGPGGRLRHIGLNDAANRYLWLVPFSLVFAAWEIAAQSRLVSPDKLPAFSTVIGTLLTSVGRVDFILRVAQSFLNLSTGIFLALGIALPLALFAGLRNRFDLALTPMVMVIGALPDLALLPLLVIWFGSGNTAAIAMAAVAAFFPLYFTVREGTKDIPRDLFHVTAIFNSSRANTLRKMILPAISPQLFTGLRLSYDFVWEIVLAIEMIARVTGVGTLIEDSVSSGSIDQAFAAIMAVGLIAIMVDRIVFGYLEGWVRRWMD